MTKANKLEQITLIKGFDGLTNNEESHCHHHGTVEL